MTKKERPEVSDILVKRLDQILSRFPEAVCEVARVGCRGRVRNATIAHVFGGEDGLLRMTFRGESDEVMAFEHLGTPYFKAAWGGNVIGLIIDDETDWVEVAELLTDSYWVVAPERLAAAVDRPHAG